MEGFFTNEDWARFKLLYLNELYLFSTEGIVQKQNSSSRAYSHVYKIANESAKKSNYRMTLRLNKEESHLSNIVKSDVDNGIDEFDNFIRYALSPQNVQKGEDGDAGTEEERDTGIEVILSLLKQLNNLNKSPVRPDTVLAALGRSETIVLNIIEKYFGLDPQELLTDAEKKDKHVRDAGKYGVIACLFNKILRLYYLYEHRLNPLSVLKDCRNTTHPTPGVLYSTYKISSGEQSNELAKFIVFTFIWIIILCRKTIVSLIYSQTAFLPAAINNKEKETEEAFKRRGQSEEDQNKSRVEALKKVFEKESPEYKSFKPGMNLHVKVIGAEPQSIEWTLKDDEVGRKINETKMLEAPDCKDVTIPGVFRYDRITIKVATSDQGSKEFNCTIPNPCTVAKESIITLYYPYQQYKVEITVNDGNQIIEEETAKLPVPDDTVTLDITSDLECSMTIPGVVQNCTVARNGNVTLRIPKGRHEITLTSKANPSYTMTREVEVTGDTVIKDMLFAEEVKNHREWWDEKDIVVLKETGSRELYKYVLWDKSVNLPVYNALCYRDDDFFASASLSLLGNFFHVRKGEINLLYSIRGSEDPLYYKLEKAFAIKDKWYALVTRYSAVVDGWNMYEGFIIDETGTEVFKLPEFCAMTYTVFAQHFKFSEGYAAMLGPDGKTISFISEKWKRRSNVYCWESDNYPVFRDGFCAVRKADEGCLFLEIKDGEICERSERYDRLVPKQGDDRWAYEAEKDGHRSLIVPEKDGGLKEILSYDSMENLSNGFRVITLTTDDGVLKKKVILNAIGKMIAEDFVDYEPIGCYGIIVTCADKKTCVYDADGNRHILGLWEGHRMYASQGVLAVKMEGCWEVWKSCNGSWNKIAVHKNNTSQHIGVFYVKEPGQGIVEMMNIDGDNLLKYAGNWVWKKDDAKIAPVSSHPIDAIDYLSKKCVYTLVTFAYILSPESIGLMRRDTLEEVVTPGYEKIERVGNLWVAYNAQGKTLFSDLGEQLLAALEIDSVQEFTSDLYIVGTEGGYCLMDAYGNMKTKCYSEIRKAANGYAAFKEYDDWGFLRISGDNVEVACSTAYYQVKDFTPEGYAMVQQNQDGDWGLIDSEGNLVVDCCYDHIDPFKCDYTSARKRVNWTIVKKKGC